MTKSSLLPAIFLPMAVHFAFTDQKLVALLVMLGSVPTRRATLWPKQMGHEGHPHRQRLRHHLLPAP